VLDALGVSDSTVRQLADRRCGTRDSVRGDLYVLERQKLVYRKGKATPGGDTIWARRAP
jgi:hypothetical protein